MDIQKNHDASRETIRHGEVYFIPITEAPDAPEMSKENGRYIVGHSETGHHHTIAASDGVLVMDKPEAETAPEGMNILYAIVKTPGVTVDHDRAAHTHASTALQPGAYQIRTQRGMTPEGWKRAID